MKTILSMLIFALLLATAPAHEALASKTSPVRLKENGTTLQGTLHLPNKPDMKRFDDGLPLVLVIHEWWGKTEYPESRAKQIADELGMAALAVDLFGKTATDPKQAQTLVKPFSENPQLAIKRLNAFIEAAPKAAGDVKLDLEETAAIGFCFGGSQALNLARSGVTAKGAELQAVVSFHGGLSSPIRSQGEIDTDILVLHGNADASVKPDEVQAFKEEMKTADADLKFIGYDGATHAFSNPKSTENGKKFNMPIAYHEKAATESWKEMKKFLSEELD